MEDPTPAQSMVFVFMPTENYLESLLRDPANTKAFEPYFKENIDAKTMTIHLIYHSIPLKVLLNDRYK